MLKEVSGAAGLIGLGSRTGIDPNTNSGGLCPWRVVGGNLFIPSQNMYNWRLEVCGSIAHCQAVLESRSLSFADSRGCGSEASSKGTGSRKASTVSHTLRKVQS